LPDYDWDAPTSATAPAGQDGGVYGESRPTTSLFAEANETFNRSLQHRQEQRNHTGPQSALLTEATSSGAAAESAAGTLRCEYCSQIFPKRYKLNKHLKKHLRPFSCTVAGCQRAFEFKKDLERHLKAKHRETVPGTALFYCPYEGCKFSLDAGAGLTRKDNLNRHIQSQHGSH